MIVFLIERRVSDQINLVSENIIQKIDGTTPARRPPPTREKNETADERRKIIFSISLKFQNPKFMFFPY